MNVPPKCDLLLIGFWDTLAVDNRGPEWQTTPHTSVSHTHTHTQARAHTRNDNFAISLFSFFSKSHQLSFSLFFTL